jgi:hypothetical protein
MGMRLILASATGVERKETHQFHGFADDPGYLGKGEADEVQIGEIDIGRALIDLLEVRGAGAWRLATLEDIEAEIANASDEPSSEETD